MKVKVVERKVKKGISLILEIYWGYQKDISGKTKHNTNGGMFFFRNKFHIKCLAGNVQLSHIPENPGIF